MTRSEIKHDDAKKHGEQKNDYAKISEKYKQKM
jgi:hypothetical protein